MKRISIFSFLIFSSYQEGPCGYVGWLRHLGWSLLWGNPIPRLLWWQVGDVWVWFSWPWNLLRRYLQVPELLRLDTQEWRHCTRLQWPLPYFSEEHIISSICGFFQPGTMQCKQNEGKPGYTWSPALILLDSGAFLFLPVPTFPPFPPFPFPIAILCSLEGILKIFNFLNQLSKKMRI